ncbi:hypothetical protein BDW71DRAFT_197412 [Aspergillus fruticulosus]
MSDHPLLQDFPWAQAPILANAPMSGMATSELAAAVISAGGLGLIGFLGNPRMLDVQLRLAKALLLHDQEAQLPPQLREWGRTQTRTRTRIFHPSGLTPKDFVAWAEGIRATSPRTKGWVQAGSVDATMQTAQACHPDALVLQGIDAGGHGHARGSSDITLIPEVSDVFIGNVFVGSRRIPLVAAGGIVDGRGVAAAMALGVSGVVMGTRFLGAQETEITQEYRRETLSASDGGQSTVRSRIFDERWVPSAWPEMYDGRCQKMRAMMSVSGVWLLWGWAGGDSFNDVSSLWAGTGMGLVKSIENARDIVQGVRGDAKQRLQDTFLVRCSS